MTTYEITENNEEFERLNLESPCGSLFQSAQWGAVKCAWSRRVVAVYRDGRLVGGASVLLRRVPGTPWKLLYAPRGPVCDPRDREALSTLTDGFRALARRERGYQLTMDPDVSITDTEFQSAMAELGYQLLPETWAFDRIQPQHLARIDLRGRSEAEVLAAMKQKTRYNIRLAERRGTVIRVCGEEALQEFYALMRETGQRDGFAVRPKRYFSRILSSLGTHARLYMAYYENVPIAGAIAAQYGDQTWYLYGASSSKHREQMPNYLLQWHMIRWAIEGGCAVYDFRGVSGGQADVKTMGLWRFKSGFGAQLQSLVGEYELPLKPAVCSLMKILVPAMRSASLFLAGLRTRLHSENRQRTDEPNMDQSPLRWTA